MRSVALVLSVSVLTFVSACTSSKPSNTISAASLEDARWSDAAIRELQDRIDRRAEHGLDRIPLSVEAAGDGANRNVALTRVALRYARMLAAGASDPEKLHKIYTLARPEVDLRAGLANALNDGKLGRWLDSLAPKDAQYAQLSRAYVALARTGQKVTPPIPEQGKPIEPGAADARIPAIVRQLGAMGYVPADATNATLYTPPIVAAVRRVQADYGIKPDSVIGGEALAILNLSDADRARAIAITMERMRWLARDPSPTRIDVNIAAATLSYWRDGKLIDARRVVVGEPDTETPQLQSPIYRLVANPTWTVPRSIQAKEIEGKGSAYLKRNDMVWKDGWVVQQPGPKNSLGLVKFDMKNDHAIYLHDTPSKALFNEAQRQRSHGCIRVFDALGFAAMIARDQGVIEQWNEAHETGEESFVSLPTEITVRLLYQTVLIDAKGRPVVRADPYGWDDMVAKSLGFAPQAGHRLRSGSSEIAP